MKNRRPAAKSRSLGQVLPMAALLITVLIGFVGLTIDVGRVFIARAQLVRAVDAAALAATLELPDMTAAQAEASAYMTENEPGAQVVTTPNVDQRQVQVHGTESVAVTFMKVFGFGSINVSANATAGFGVIAVDTVMAIDATGSMGTDSGGNSCSNTPGCPIYEAKNAAKSFTDTLLSGSTSSSETLVGVSPYRGCYNTPNPYSACIPISTMVQPLSNSKTTINSKIDSVTAVGGTGTNICNGMNEANQVLFGANHHTASNMLHIVVILSDGDNTYNAIANGAGVATPQPYHSTPTPNPAWQLPAACRPSNPNQSDGDVSTSCRSAQTHEQEVDTKTLALVDSMKASGVEVYVVGLGVCGSSSTALCNRSLVGGTSSDNTADRNLLKCLASSTALTNDHYFEATTASQLPGIFTNIARLIGFRLIQ